MNCATFRDSHSLLLDGMLGDADVVAMECHIVECPACAAHDARVRRGLELFRSAAPVAPSADFNERLHARIAAERRAGVRAQAPAAMRGPGLGMFAAAAASVAAAGFLAATLAPGGGTRELALPPVVASRPAAPPTPIVADASPTPMSGPAIMASVSAGMPLWSSALLVEQAPLHFATSEFELTSYGR